MSQSLANISKPNTGGLARTTANHWMNVMRGIQWTCVGARFVPPLQGGEVCSAHDLGLGAVRLTPGCHIAGFQPAGSATGS
jgi:hypothetical protein